MSFCHRSFLFSAAINSLKFAQGRSLVWVTWRRSHLIARLQKESPLLSGQREIETAGLEKFFR